MDLWALLHRCKADRRLALALMVPNALGIGYGYYYYHQVGQFDPGSTFFRHPGWWPLVADSPNAVLIASVTILLYAFLGWRSKWLDAAAFTLMVYVGLWTTSLFLLYPERMGTFAWERFPENANPLLFVSHMGMPLEALIFVRDLRRDPWRLPSAAAVLGALALFVTVDYWGPHLHPAPFLHPGDAALHAVSPWLMVATAVAWIVCIRFRARGAPGTPPPAPQDPA